MIVEQGNESILEEAHRLTHGARNVDYGHPLDDYTRTAALVSAMLAHKLSAALTAHEMALVMVCVKLSREMNAPKRDNRTDGAGYFWVADQCLQETERRAQPVDVSRPTVLGGHTLPFHCPPPPIIPEPLPPPQPRCAWCIRTAAEGHAIGCPNDEKG